MSVESLLLSTWEEEGFVGKARVPVGKSDVDVLAIHAGTGTVRVGESKVQQGSQRVYLVDDASLSNIEKAPHQDFTAWLDGWSEWLENLPRLWDETGQPTVPWLLHAQKVEKVQVVFCCNLYILCDRQSVDAALQRAAVRFLQMNPWFTARPEFAGRVQASVKATVEVVAGLLKAVFHRIEAGYGRRFADPFKDLFREVHRYLRPELDRLPYDKVGQKLGTQKAPFHSQIRKETVLWLLRAAGVGEEELKKWLAGEGAAEEDPPGAG